MMAAVVIVGAGVTGLLTAIECARAGHRVTVLDHGAIPNPACSSFDQHRAFRMLAPGEAAGTRRMVTALRRWLELENLLGVPFYRRVGIVTTWPRAELAAVTGFAAAAGVSVETVEPDMLPHLGFPAGSAGVLEVDAGVLLAARVLHAAARWLAGHPAVTIRPRSEVTSVDVNSGRIGLAGGPVLGADVVMLAAGPWTQRLVDARVVLYRQTMVYLRPPEDLAQWWEQAPGAGRLGADGLAWLLPPGAGTLLKLSTDGVCHAVSTVDEEGSSEPWADRVLATGIVSDMNRYTVVDVRHCHYVSDAETGGALFTRVGPAVWSRAACGGSGFSSAPLVADEFVSAMDGAA